MADKQRTNLAKQLEQTKSLPPTPSKRFPYFKPTRYKHDSGFRCFEIGYCTVDAKGNAVEIEVLGRCTDHIWSYKSLLGGSKESMTWNMDLLNNGYIRVFSHHGTLVWDCPYALSSMAWELKADTKGSDLRLDDPEATTTATNTSPNQSP